MYSICHISSAHPQEDVRIFEKECVSLAANGYKVYLITQGESYQKKGVSFLGLGKKPESRIKRMLFFTRKAYKKALAVDADLYHFHDPELLPYALRLAKKGKKVVFDSHEFTALQLRGNARKYIPKPLRSTIAFVYEKYETAVLRKIDGVIVPCLNRGKDYFKGNYKRIAYVNNVPRLSDFPYEPDVKKEPNSVCYVGSISRERGIVNTIVGAHKAGCVLHLIGEIGDELSNDIRSMVEYESVKCYGRLSLSEFPSIVQKMEVGLCLVLNIGQYDEGDNLSTKIYEYMALGLPVVVSDLRMNRLIIEKYNCGICVNPDDPTEIAEAIKTIIDNPELAKNMGANGRKIVENSYCWEHEEQNLFELYEDILG